MGISSNTIKLLARTFKDRKFSGSCVTFGVMGIEGKYDDIKEILKRYGYDFNELDRKDIIIKDVYPFGKSVDQGVLFRMLGFSDVHSIDYYENEHPTYKLDLNEPCPEYLHNKYDLVYDGGTMEHCFNTKEVLSNAVSLLKPGGRVIHESPASGFINHGFYQFSTNLFLDFYASNNFRDMELIIRIGDYYLDYYRFKKLVHLNDFFGNKSLIFFSAVKNSESNEIITPQQDYYMSLFGKEGMQHDLLNKEGKLLFRLKTFIKDLPGPMFNLFQWITKIPLVIKLLFFLLRKRV